MDKVSTACVLLLPEQHSYTYLVIYSGVLKCRSASQLAQVNYCSIHYMNKSIGTPDLMNKDFINIAFKHIDCNMVLGPFAAVTTSTLLGRLSTKFWIVFVRICPHSFCNAFMR